MIKCREVMDVMERIAPKRLAEDWDNPGLLVGSPDDEIRRILVCLDVREETAERAQAERPSWRTRGSITFKTLFTFCDQNTLKRGLPF